LITFLHNRVIGVQPGLTAVSLPAPGLATPVGPGSRPPATAAAPCGSLAGPAITARPAEPAITAHPAEPASGVWSGSSLVPLAGAVLVALPVFLQAPWVRLAPVGAALFTLPLLLVALLLEGRRSAALKDWGALLVGFSGSWLGGCLFWGWCRLHPLWHLPLEAFALPLALGGLWPGSGQRWRLAASFYLASLLGTACTDGVMAITGVMGHWVNVLAAPLDQAPVLLQQAALEVFKPLPLTVTVLTAMGLVAACRRLWHHPDPAWRLAASAVATTLAVDGLFLAVALWSPRLSGLI
jgi:hypothetical protein